MEEKTLTKSFIGANCKLVINFGKGAVLTAQQKSKIRYHLQEIGKILCC